MTYLFWCAALFTLWTYVGYPLVITLAARRRALVPAGMPAEWPAVSVIVPFCNEPERVRAKLDTLRSMDYPRDRLQIVFVADGEGNGTADAVRQCDGVEQVVLPGRRGKPAALNAGLARAEHDLVLFSDARQQIDASALRRLVARILQPGIGAVSGELVQLDDADRAQIGLYWKYELAIRKAESRFASVPGVTGALWLVRKVHCRPLPEDALLDDVEMPLAVLQAGQRVVLESGARVYDRVAEDVARERARKIRTLAGNVQVFVRHPWLFLPTRNPIWWQFLSHKVARLLVPYALLLLFVLPLFLTGPVYKLIWAGQAAFYLMALGSSRAWPLCRGRLAATARLFAELNVAAVQGTWRYFRAPVDPRWEKTS